MAEVAIDKADSVATGPATYVDWGSVVAGAIAAAAVSFVFAQCYRRGGRLKKFATIGEAELAGTADPLF